MDRMTEKREVDSMRRSLSSRMGEPLVTRISELIAGHRELSISPDVITSGQPARGLLLSDPELRVRGSIFYPCNPPARHRERSGEAGGCVPRSGTRAKKTQGFNDFNDFDVLNESAAGGR